MADDPSHTGRVLRRRHCRALDLAVASYGYECGLPTRLCRNPQGKHLLGWHVSRRYVHLHGPRSVDPLDVFSNYADAEKRQTKLRLAHAINGPTRVAGSIR